MKSQDLSTHHTTPSRFMQLFCLGALLFNFNSQGLSAKGRVSIVSVKAAHEIETSPMQIFEGTTVAIRQSQFASPEEGIVKKRLIWYGVPVKKGQIILELDDRKQKARVLQLEAESEALRATYEMVAKGARKEELNVVRANFESSRAQLEESQKNYERVEELFEQKVESMDKLDLAREELQVNQAAYDSAQNQLALIQAGNREEEVEIALQKWKASMMHLQEAKIHLEDMKVRAPFSGTAGEIKTEEGGWLSQGDPIAEVFDSNYIDVIILVPESQIRFIRTGVQIKCIVPALANLKIRGLVASIGPNATLQGKTIPVIVRFQNPGLQVRPGMRVLANLPVGQIQPRVLIEKDAVLRSLGQPPKVFIHKDGKAHPRNVELGLEFGDQIQALTGVSAGDELITRGNERLQPNAAVAIEQKSSAHSPRSQGPGYGKPERK